MNISPAWMWIDSCMEIPSDGEVMITARPQRGPFRAERMIVPSSIAICFDLLDLKIGNRSQRGRIDPIPMSRFSSVLTSNERELLAQHWGPHELALANLTPERISDLGRPVQIQACECAQDIVLSVRGNGVAVAPMRFEMFLIGTMAVYQ